MPRIIIDSRWLKIQARRFGGWEWIPLTAKQRQRLAKKLRGK